MKYLTDVGIVPIPNFPDLFYLDGELIWESSRGFKIHSPAGFITDDASIPKVLDWIPFLDRQGRSRRPGLTHDSLYSLFRLMGKDFADACLKEACIDEGMDQWQANIIWEGVHQFGNSSWSQDRGNGSFGVIKIGNFITKDYYDKWIAAGKTMLKPI